jgi:hypothetical protein
LIYSSFNLSKDLPKRENSAKAIAEKLTDCKTKQEDLEAIIGSIKDTFADMCRHELQIRLLVPSSLDDVINIISNPDDGMEIVP